jgi:D-3-phosphoglycerate dehydrogenase
MARLAYRSWGREMSSSREQASTAGTGRASVVVTDAEPGDATRLGAYAQRLEAAGADVSFVVPGDDLDAALTGADLVVVLGRRHLPREAVTHLGRAVGVLCYSIGMDKVPEEVRAAGLPVRNIPDYCVDEVADHALALILAAERRVVAMDRGMRDGGWDGARAAAPAGSIRRLRGRQMAVVGAGRIGRRVAARARAFGYETLAVDPFLTEDPDPGFVLTEATVAVAEADVIVLCAAMSERTHHLVDEAYLSGVRPGVILVNVARGGLVDEQALLGALDDGRVAVAALDVREQEPPAAVDALAAHPKVIATPHQAATSVEAVEELHEKAATASIEMLAAAGRIDG